MFRRYLKHALAVMAVTVSLTGVASAEPTARMLVILTSAETETQAMALVLSNQVAKEGTPVHLILCGPAGDIALDTPPETATQVVTPKGMTVRSLLEGLMKKGGTVDVCAIYLPNRKLALDALMDGVGAAKPPAIATEMIAADTRLATF